MKCVDCSQKLRVTHTFDAGTGARTSTAVCRECDQAFTLLQIVVCAATKRNEGAYALAQRVKRAPAKVTLPKS